MKTGEKGIELIKFFESLHDGDLSKIGLQPKECPAGILTIGYGHALQDTDGKWLKGKDGFKKISTLYPEWETITEKEADEILKNDLVKFEKIVANKLKVEVTQNQFDALVSHTFNTGGSDTLFKLINTKSTDQQILKWFTETYISANGKVLPGLIKRRKIEATLFLTGKLEL